MELGGLTQKLKGGKSSTRHPVKVKAGGTLYSPEDFQDLQIEQTQINTGVRLFFYRIGCNVCPRWEKAVREVNPRLPRGENITRVDIESQHPAIEWLQPEGTPQIYVDGISVKGATTSAGALGFLKGLLEDSIQYGIDRVEPI